MGKINQTLSAQHLFMVAAISYFLAYGIGSLIGEAFGLIGLITLIIAFITLVREAKEKRQKNEDKK